MLVQQEGRKLVAQGLPGASREDGQERLAGQYGVHHLELPGAEGSVPEHVLKYVPQLTVARPGAPGNEPERGKSLSPDATGPWTHFRARRPSAGARGSGRLPVGLSPLRLAAALPGPPSAMPPSSLPFFRMELHLIAFSTTVFVVDVKIHLMYK